MSDLLEILNTTYFLSKYMCLQGMYSNGHPPPRKCLFKHLTNESSQNLQGLLIAICTLLIEICLQIEKASKEIVVQQTCGKQ